MESLDRSKAVIDLGKRLVIELKLGDDMLAQWMAHLIAERMDAAEHASSELRDSAQNACREAILTLWKHRNNLPSHIRPFKELDPVIQTLASLDVNSGSRFRYISHSPVAEELDGVAVNQKPFLDTALNLDYSARVLIQYLLSAASKDAAEKASSWLDLTINAEADAVLELRVVEFVSDGVTSPDGEEIARDALLDKIQKLEAFSQLATTVISELRSQLAQIAGTKKASGSLSD
jgi:hypothetical protein